MTRDPRVDPQPGDVFRLTTERMVKTTHIAHVFPDGSVALAVEWTYPARPAWSPDYDAIYVTRPQLIDRLTRAGEIVTPSPPAGETRG